MLLRIFFSLCSSFLAVSSSFQVPLLSNLISPRETGFAAVPDHLGIHLQRKFLLFYRNGPKLPQHLLMQRQGLQDLRLSLLCAAAQFQPSDRYVRWYRGGYVDGELQYQEPVAVLSKALCWGLIRSSPGSSVLVAVCADKEKKLPKGHNQLLVTTAPWQ